MHFWKSLAIGFAILLGLSFLGFAYVFSQVMETARPKPRVVTLLKNQNVTFDPLSYPTNYWNISIDVIGYKTGFLYCRVFQTDNATYGGTANKILSLQAGFETDGIYATGTHIGYIERNGAAYKEIDLIGSRMRIYASANYRWAVMSMSLYLRD